MHIDIFLLKIFFLFFPGIIAFFIIDLLTEVKARNSLHHILYIFVLGIISYSSTEILYKVLNFLFHNACINVNTKLIKFSLDLSCIHINSNFLNCLFKEHEIPYLYNVIFTTIIAIIIGLILTYIIQNGKVHKLAQKLNISRKFSDSTVWGYILNSKDLSQWITVRDIKNDLIYQGWLAVFSAENKNNELFLTDVIVYRNSTGKELYQTYGLYITRKEDDLTIEFYKPESEETKNGK